MERAKADGWRYLKLPPREIESLTPREFTILMQAQQERQFDDYERMAYGALMTRQAYHSTKRLGLSDLFKRPVGVEQAEKKTGELIEKSRHASEWMSQFALFSGGDVGKE